MATSCATELDKATCGNVSQAVLSCDFSDLADPAPAVKACNDFVTAICKHSLRCTSQTEDACRAEAATKVDCSAAIGVGLTYEQCLSEIDTTPCSSPSAPASCSGTIKVSQ